MEFGPLAETDAQDSAAMTVLLPGAELPVHAAGGEAFLAAAVAMPSAEMLESLTIAASTVEQHSVGTAEVSRVLADALEPGVTADSNLDTLLEALPVQGNGGDGLAIAAAIHAGPQAGWDPGPSLGTDLAHLGFGIESVMLHPDAVQAA
jgi:hypothetical protein